MVIRHIALALAALVSNTYINHVYAEDAVTSGYATSAEFSAYLAKNKALANALQQNPRLAQYVMSSPATQNDLMSGKLTLEKLQAGFNTTHSSHVAMPAHVELLPSVSAHRDLASTAAVTNDRAADDLHAFLNGDNSSAINVAVDSAADAIDRKVPEPSTEVSTGPTPPVSTPTPVTPTPAALPNYDVNLVPAQADLVADATGWPKYLKVPAGCPAPQGGKRYFHEALTYDWAETGSALAGYGTPGYTGIAPAFKTVEGGHRWTHLKQNQAFAVPLLTPGVTANPYGEVGGSRDPGGNGQSRVAKGVASGMAKVSLAYCPGDYTNATPAGKTPLAVSCSQSTGNGIVQYAIAAPGSGLERKMKAEGRCVLSTAERYFYNIEFNTPDDFFAAGKPAGLMLSSKTDNLATPLYAGPCLPSAPYPLGYKSADCGETRHVPGDGTSSTTTADTYSCYDPYNQEAPVTFTRLWDAEQKRLVWTNGYRKPLFSRFVCELGRGGVVDPQNRVCAVHREGELRTRSFTNPAFQEIEQCQYDPQTKRFEWAYVSRSELVRHVRQGQGGGIATSYERPLEHDGCAIGGQVYSYGTRANITCGAGSHTETATALCTPRKTKDGSQNLLGTFVFESGYITSYNPVVASNRCRYTFN